MKELEMSWRNQRGDAKGIAGGECGRGGVKPHLAGSGGLRASHRTFSNFGYFFLQSRDSSALFQEQDFSRNLKKNLILQINKQIKPYSWEVLYTIQCTQPI